MITPLTDGFAIRRGDCSAAAGRGGQGRR